jgi:hypothetical protein
MGLQKVNTIVDPAHWGVHAPQCNTSVGRQLPNRRSSSWKHHFLPRSDAYWATECSLADWLLRNPTIWAQASFQCHSRRWPPVGYPTKRAPGICSAV